MQSPKPPYYAVIFRSRLETGDEAGYALVADEMAALAERQPGYLGITSVRDAEGNGITVSYWETEDAIKGWRDNLDHVAAREKGRALWYADYTVEVCKVERAYSGAREARD